MPSDERKKMKTPCYIIDGEKIRENYNRMRAGIRRSGRDDIIAYSVKANYHEVIADILNAEGAYFEVCSEYEFQMVQKRGVAPERIIVNSCASLENIMGWGENSLVILDSFEQLKAWQLHNGIKKIGIRINPDYFTRDERFRNRQSRFGIDTRDEEVQKFLKRDDVRRHILCVHCHLAGNNREPSIYSDVIQEISDIIHTYRLCNVEFIDIGGGFKTGSGYHDFSEYAEAVYRQCEKLKVKAKIIYEPGNSVVRNAVCYCTKVIAEKKLCGKTIKIVDGSSLQLPRTNLKKLECEIIGTSGEVCREQIVAGATCRESDIITVFEQKPEIGIGSIMVFKNVGAYSMNEINGLILGMPDIRLKEETESCYAARAGGHVETDEEM